MRMKHQGVNVPLFENHRNRSHSETGDLASAGPLPPEDNAFTERMTTIPVFFFRPLDRQRRADPDIQTKQSVGLHPPLAVQDSWQTKQHGLRYHGDYDRRNKKR